MVCQYCTTIRTFDLTRDPDLLAPLPSGVRSRLFPCLKCNHTHDATAIEAALIELLNRQAAAYQLNDLRCTRCKQLKANNLAIYCECSGTYSTGEARPDFVKRLQMTASVAEFYAFKNLLDVCRWLKSAM